MFYTTVPCFCTTAPFFSTRDSGAKRKSVVFKYCSVFVHMETTKHKRNSSAKTYCSVFALLFRFCTTCPFFFHKGQRNKTEKCFFLPLFRFCTTVLFFLQRNKNGTACFCTTVPCFCTTVPFFFCTTVPFFPQETTEQKRNNMLLRYSSFFFIRDNGTKRNSVVFNYCSVFFFIWKEQKKQNGTVCFMPRFPVFV